MEEPRKAILKGRAKEESARGRRRIKVDGMLTALSVHSVMGGTLIGVDPARSITLVMIWP